MARVLGGGGGGGGGVYLESYTREARFLTRWRRSRRRRGQETPFAFRIHTFSVPPSTLSHPAPHLPRVTAAAAGGQLRACRKPRSGRRHAAHALTPTRHACGAPPARFGFPSSSACTCTVTFTFTFTGAGTDTDTDTWTQDADLKEFYNILRGTLEAIQPARIACAPRTCSLIEGDQIDEEPCPFPLRLLYVSCHIVKREQELGELSSMLAVTHKRARTQEDTLRRKHATGSCAC